MAKVEAPIISQKTQILFAGDWEASLLLRLVLPDAVGLPRVLEPGPRASDEIEEVLIACVLVIESPMSLVWPVLSVVNATLVTTSADPSVRVVFIRRVCPSTSIWLRSVCSTVSPYTI